jgi:hypothetical protein
MIGKIGVIVNISGPGCDSLICREIGPSKSEVEVSLSRSLQSPRLKRIKLLLDLAAVESF